MIQNLYSIHCFYFPSQTHSGRYGAVSRLSRLAACSLQVFRLHLITRHRRTFCRNFLRQTLVVHHGYHEFRIVANRRPQQVRAIPRCRDWVYRFFSLWPRRVRRETGGAVPRSPRGDQWRRWAFCLLLAVVVFAMYFPALSHPFVIYDDVDYVSQNRQVQQGLTLGTLRWALTSMQFSNWHPLTWMSHALDCELFGLDAGGHHFTSLLLHAIDAVILFLLLSRITGKIGRSLLVAALFALHPVNVESVAWVAERKTVLSMLFLLLALWAYLWYVRKPGIGRHVCMDALFALALAAKPMAVTFPFLLLLLDYWPMQRVKLQPINDWQSPSGTLPLPQFPPFRLLLEKLPLFALSAASCTVTVIAQHRVAMQTMEAFPLRDRVVNALFSYVMYLWEAVWPVHLSVFYAPQGSRLAIWQAALCMAFLIAISILVWTERRSRPYFLFGWLWFLGTLVPMIGIVQVGDQGMADRYAYLPYVGIFIPAVWGLADLAQNIRLEPKWSAAAACAVLLVLFFLTRRQLQYWESSEVLFHALLASDSGQLRGRGHCGDGAARGGISDDRAEVLPRSPTAFRECRAH